jgi:hypothetical protein
VRAAGGDPRLLPGIDGLDQWAALTLGTDSPRVEMLYNIDPLGDPKSGNGPCGAVR